MKEPVSAVAKENAVLRNPLSKLRDHRRPLRKDAEEALHKLAELAEQHPDLAELAATQATLMEVSFRAAPPAVPVALNAARAATKLQVGVPLLRGETISIDPRRLRERFVQLCDALIEQAGQSTATTARRVSARSLKQAVKRATLDPHALLLDVLHGNPQMVAERAAALDLDAGLTATLLRWTLLPVLEPIAKQLAALHENATWQHGYCPTCGAWPILAEQRGIEQIRVLRCGLCAGEWRMERSVCPFCGSRNHADSAYLYEERSAATQRAVTCERCHCYYKAVATLAPLSTPMLFVTDLATLHLDLIALERAYGPPA